MTKESSSRVFAGDGRPLTLDRALKSGGAGSIHRIVESPDLVAKLYHPQVDHAIYERKLEAMISFVPDLPDITEGGVREAQIAWPRFLLRDRQRRFVGFAMPLIDFATSVEVECVLQERQARAQRLPTGLGAKVTLAANLASLIAELHRQGHFVFDLKPVNLRFYRRTLHIAMLDCDGYSIKGESERFSATQYTPEYLAPEFQRPGLSAGGDLASNEASQDRFALAVIIFQLLNFGIHPFTGRPASERVPTDIPGRIAHRCYAYGARANSEMAPNPASGHTVMPLDLRQLFDRAFTAIGLARPSADDWVSLLQGYGRRSTGLLVTCRVNASHQHFAGLRCGACARAALLTKAASVVRAPVRNAPARTARRAARLPTARLSAPLTPAIWPPPSHPSPPRSLSSGRWKPLVAVIPALILVLSLLCRESPKSAQTRRMITDSANTKREERVPERLTPVARLDEVLKAARAYGKGAILQELGRLPTSWEQGQKECRAAAESWHEKVQWTKGDLAYAKDRYVVLAESQPDSCTNPYFFVLRIVRTMELCMRRLHSPGAYPGVGEAECQQNLVIPAGVDTIQRILVHWQSLEPSIWERMAEAFLLSDDYYNAQAAFVISALLYRNREEWQFFQSVIEEGSLHEREEILRARAMAKVRSWNDEPVSDEISAKLRAPWPAEPAGNPSSDGREDSCSLLGYAGRHGAVEVEGQSRGLRAGPSRAARVLRPGKYRGDGSQPCGAGGSGLPPGSTSRVSVRRAWNGGGDVRDDFHDGDIRIQRREDAACRGREGCHRSPRARPLEESDGGSDHGHGDTLSRH